MKKSLLCVTAALLTAASGKELPLLFEKPFLGAWIGYEEDGFDAAIQGEGWAEIFFKKEQRDGLARISPFLSLKLKYSVQEKIGERWVNRSIEKDGFETEIEASTEVEDIEFTATFKGGTKVKVNHIFDGDEILTRIAQVSTESKNELRIGVKVAFPDLYRLKEKLSEDELEEKLDGDEIRATRVDKKRFKFDLHEEVDLADEKVLGKGAIEYSLESKRLADREITLSNAKGSKGVFRFEPTKSLHVPLDVIWYPETPTSTMVLEIK